MTPQSIIGRSGRRALVALAVAGFAGAALAEQMTWTVVSVLEANDPAARTFVRRGVATFPNGDIATVRFDGSSMASDGRSLTYDVKLTYTFEDGSTFIHQGKGRTTSVPGKYADQSGSGTFVGGTGRFAGITGKTESVGKGVSQMDAWGQFKAEYTIAK